MFRRLFNESAYRHLDLQFFNLITCRNRFNLDESVVQPVLHPSATPAANPAALAAAPSSGCAGVKPPTCVGCSTSGSTVGQPSGSDRCSVLRLDRWQALDFRRLLRASVRPVADLPTCAGVLPPARPATNCRLTPGADSSARHVPNIRLSPSAVAAFGLRLVPLRLSSLRWLSPVCHTGGELPTRIGCYGLRLYQFRSARLAPCFSTSGWAFGAPLASIGPCIAS